MSSPSPPPPFDPGALRLGCDLRRSGVEPCRDPAWHHVSHGAWLPAQQWAELSPERRHAALVYASGLRQRSRSPRTYALTSAAAIWGLPRIEAWPEPVTVLVADPAARGSRLVRPHLGAPAEAVDVEGVRVTSVARTVADLARTGSLVTAVAAADHALRHRMCSADELAAEVAAIPRSSPGRRMAALVRDLADARSMSPGESLSRAQMYLLNVPRPELQRSRRDALGLIGVVDFDWGSAVGEFDGQVKYRVQPGADPQEAGEVVWREKKREDRLRRQAEVGRWVWAEARDRNALATVLAGIGIRSLPRNTWFDLGARRAG
ncbi:hypothetical protein H9L10_03775 [Phycicoccus endophyticus]|uniref:Transcriptional regulator, AbiEi antitoxin, Type IV TA system n=1 Tax=Phycicoccus endophyticus TaxID=1690220 RepID=A0A7G9R3L0_9MICO|nr:hypothetical protein [Phycicoccus endophyticus]NHI19944.1 hypothetical protein [Phycicoccus endophyticus]QNN50185.1 hypothetical protein H9L10_03775 [Phycicoccus endophyticus]GGL27266.1 hypothetical protein GCM10012283_06890 [Phycicoccus endophyticus]